MTDLDYIEKAQWLIDHGHANDDVFKLAEKLKSINSRNEKEDAPTSPSPEHNATKEESRHV